MAAPLPLLLPWRACKKGRATASGLFARVKQTGSLFPSKRVFKAADSVLNLAFHLVDLAFRFQFGVADCLAND